jgi:AbrB family looped-hinge helix DNA binding protein
LPFATGVIPSDVEESLYFARTVTKFSSKLSPLTVTTRGQVTFRKDVLQHLGIEPGEKIELDKLPDGRITLRAIRPAGTIDNFVGLLAGKTKKVATLEEISEAAAARWAGKR